MAEMSEGYKKGWDMGYKWAKENHYIDSRGWKNVDGGKLGRAIPNGQYGIDAGFAEGVRCFLGEKEKI